MTESDYFDALTSLIIQRLRKSPSASGATYELKELGQPKFDLNTRGLTSNFAIQLEKLPHGDWLCFKTPHPYAHKKCDCIVVGWDRQQDIPKYLLIELKSKRTGTARQQLQASLAFCHFVHRMVCVNTSRLPDAKFAAVTVKQFPFAQKLTSRIAVPSWDSQALRSDCGHMTYDRAFGSLPLAHVMNQF